MGERGKAAAPVGALQGRHRSLSELCARRHARREQRLVGPTLRGFAEGLAQLVLGFLQPCAVGRGQVLAGAVDVEHQHRHGRSERIGLAALARFRRTLERGAISFGSVSENTPFSRTSARECSVTSCDQLLAGALAGFLLAMALIPSRQNHHNATTSD